MSPAVVTGLGVAAPTGLDVGAHWAATLRGASGIRRVTSFSADGYPAKLAGEVTGFAAADHLPGRLVPQTDRSTQLALVAAEAALADAAVEPAALPELAMGVVTASASGGFEFGQRELQNLWSKGRRHVSAYMSFAWFYAVNSGQLSIRHGMRGPTGVFVGEQAGGLDAVGHARRLLRKGMRLVVTGGMDGSLCPYGWVAQLASGRLTTRDDPARAYLPFSSDASGHVPGEGGAILVLEDAAAARERGAGQGYGLIAGYGATFDPKPGTGARSGLRRAAALALDDAGVAPAEVDVVFADAAGTLDLDRVEAEAITDLFGPYGVAVTAPKTLTGRLYSGGAPLDLVGALLSMRDGVIPATAHTTRVADGYEIDLVIGEPRRSRPRTALVLARGLGGFNAAMLVRAPEPAG
jgi:act minimal PKS chain-length factor (CLF/KS beta)